MFLRFHQNLRLDVLINFVLIKKNKSVAFIARYEPQNDSLIILNI